MPAHTHDARCLLTIALVYIGIACTTGCSVLTWWIGEKTFYYDYTGCLYSSDGAPSGSTRVSLQVSRSDASLERAEWQRILDSDAVSTGPDGCYHGRFSILAAGPGADRPAKRIQEAFLYVEQPAGWSIYKVRLDEKKQQPTARGRNIEVPPLTIGRDLAIVDLTSEAKGRERNGDRAK